MKSKDNKSIISAAPALEDKDITVRPAFLAEFIGQKKIIENLNIFIKGAKGRARQLDHTLFYGPPGLGKTTLAQIIAQEMGVNFKATSGPALTKAADLASILTNLQKGDVLFIDEIHRLNISVEEILYSAMEDFMLDIIIGEGPSARSVRIDLPPFTLVGATTRLGLLSSPLRDRFGIPLRLSFYSYSELAQVITRASNIMNIKIDEQGAAEISRRARATPRIALRLLSRARDFADYKAKQIIDQEIASYTLDRLEVDSAGLDGNDYRYLKFIAENYDGGPVGVDTISAALYEHRDAIEETIEPYLIQIGMLQRTSRGRQITELAFNHLGIKQSKS